MVKKILKIALWVITGAALVILFVFGRRWYLETPLKGIDFHLERSGSHGFVVKDSVLSRTENLCGFPGHAHIGSVNMAGIQKMLYDNPWIENSSAYIGLNDTLTIQVKEYEPVLRVFNQYRQSVYVTAEGVIVPSSPIYTPHLIIASGNFDFPTPYRHGIVTDSIYANTGITESLTIAKAILKDDFLKDNIGQIYKDINNEYELSVNDLSARVVLGDTTAIDKKLTRLRILLERFGGTEELVPYETLNLKYNNQIVCTKK